MTPDHSNVSVRALRRGTMAGRGAAAGTPTTYTIYSDAADAYITSTPAGADGSGSPGTGDIYCGMQSGAAWEGFLSFNTSTVLGTITAVTLSLYGMNDSSTTDFTLEARLYNWGASVTAADWRAAASFGALPLVASKATAGWVVSAYNALTSEAAFLSNINQSGTTYLILASDRFRTGITPTGTEYVGFRSRDTGSTTTGPKLVIDALV